MSILGCGYACSVYNSLIVEQVRERDAGMRLHFYFPCLPIWHAILHLVTFLYSGIFYNSLIVVMGYTMNREGVWLGGGGGECLSHPPPQMNPSCDNNICLCCVHAKHLMRN